MDHLAASQLAVEVVCAMPDRQRIATVTVAPGTTAREAVRLSGLAADFPELDIARCALGIWGEEVADDQPIAAGDRVEVYRPLQIDPREARRALAASGRTMGSGPAV